MLSTMNKQILTISKGEHLGDVLGTIPTNTIVCKTITGCGATTSEILAPRNSIIIEPNVPVIMGKASKHPDILGVCEGITKEDIEAYLNTTPEGGYYKIMTTPESYAKVHNAITHTKGTPYKD